jgi:hypothetical protein
MRPTFAYIQAHLEQEVSLVRLVDVAQMSMKAAAAEARQGDVPVSVAASRRT